MDASMKKFMRVGLVHFMAFPQTMRGEGPILDTFRRIAYDDYFDVAEVTWIKDPEIRRAIGTMADVSKMTLCYGAQPRLLTTGLNINDLDEAGRRKAVDSLREGIDEAYEIGAAGFAFLSGKYEQETREESYQALFRSTLELCDYAKTKGNMPVNLEIFDYDIDKKALIGPTWLAKRFADDVRMLCDNFGLMVDLSHIPMYRESIHDAIVPIKNHIAHIHIGNTVIRETGIEAYGDTHPRFGVPGSENDVPQVVEFLRVLLENGILNESHPPVVSFEVKPWKDEDAELVLANAKRVLNRAWALA